MTAATIHENKNLPAQFEYAIASEGDKNTIEKTESPAGIVSQLKGFPTIYSTPRKDGGKSVSRKDMNGLFNMLSRLNYYFQYMGRNPWVSGTSYPMGAIVWKYSSTDGGSEYVSKANNNTTDPASSTTWVKIGTATGLVVDSSSIKDAVESIIDTKLTADYLDTKLRYKIVITSTSPGTYATNTLYFITGT